MKVPLLIIVKNWTSLIINFVLLLRMQVLNWLHCGEQILMKAFQNGTSFAERNRALLDIHFLFALKIRSPDRVPFIRKRRKSGNLLEKNLKYWKFKEKQFRDQRMIQDLVLNRTKQFWSDVRRRRGRKLQVWKKVDNGSDPKQISELFVAKFSQVTGEDVDDDWYAALRDSHGRCRFTSSAVQAGINKLNEGNGFDELHSNQLNNLNSLTIVYLKKWSVLDSQINARTTNCSNYPTSE